MGTIQLLSDKAIIGMYYKALEQDPGVSWVNAISAYFESMQPSETYRWLGQAPVMRQWVGGRQYQTLKSEGVTIINQPYESTLDFFEDDIRRDKTGQIQVRINEHARRANAHWASLLSTLIINGESTTCYDAQYYFDTDHSEGSSGTQSNDIQVDISALPCNQHGSTTIPSPEEMELSILKAIQQIYGFKDDQGQPMNENAMSFLVMVPVSFWHAASSAISDPVLTSGKTNTIVNLSKLNIQVVSNPRLTWTEEFVVFRTDANVKSFIHQDEYGVRTMSKWIGSEYHFDNKKVAIGIDASRNVGYGYWQNSCLVTLV